MDTITNSMGMQFVEIPAGAFMMGGDKVAEQADDNETPCHKVQFENPFYMSMFTVTQAQWMAIFDEIRRTGAARGNGILARRSNVHSKA